MRDDGQFLKCLQITINFIVIRPTMYVSKSKHYKQVGFTKIPR